MPLRTLPTRLRAPLGAHLFKLRPGGLGRALIWAVIWSTLCAGAAVVSAAPDAADASVEAGRLLPAPDQSGKWGYVDAADGRVVIAPRYSRAGMFNGGYAVVHLSFPQAGYTVFAEDGARLPALPRGDGIINVAGEEVLPPLDGQFVAPAVPEGARRESDLSGPPGLPGLFEVRNSGGRGVLDAESGWVLELGPNEDIRFQPDGSFIFNGSGYISAAPERDIYFAPGGWRISGVDLARRLFRLEGRATGREGRSLGLAGLARWSGESLNPSPYRDLADFAACGRWAGLTPDGRLELFDDSGTVLRDLPAELEPRLAGGGILFASGGAALTLDPCSLKESPAPVPPPAPPLESSPVPSQESSPAPWSAPWSAQSPDPSPGRLAEPEFRVVLRDSKALLLDGQGRERIPPLYEILLPAGYGYWWGRYAETQWVLIDAADGREIRISEPIPQ